MMNQMTPVRRISDPGAPKNENIVPVTILTGFLGAGKTTLLNRVLYESHGRRLAVIVNEFGELGVDGALVAGAAGSVIELANGCICCATRGQLLSSVRQVLAGDIQLDGILIETSGLADPCPVMDELAHSSLSDHARLDGVIAVVDALNFDRNLDSAEAAYQQIVSADIILINKTDLVDADIPGRIEQGVRHLNAHARVAYCSKCDVPMDVLVGPGYRHGTPLRCSEPASHQHDGFESIVLRIDRPVSPDRLSDWLGALPPSVFRAKGFLRLQGLPGLTEVSAVGTRYALEPAAGQPDDTVTGLVLIGRGMPADALGTSLESCA